MFKCIHFHKINLTVALSLEVIIKCGKLIQLLPLFWFFEKCDLCSFFLVLSSSWAWRMSFTDPLMSSMMFWFSWKWKWVCCSKRVYCKTGWQSNWNINSVTMITILHSSPYSIQLSHTHLLNMKSNCSPLSLILNVWVSSRGDAAPAESKVFHHWF